MRKFDSSPILQTLERDSDNGPERRRFLRQAGIAGLMGALGAYALNNPTITEAQGGVLNDVNILNFALNLEYLEAEFYVRAAFGRGLADSDTDGTGTRGAVTGGRAVPFASEAIRQYATEIARDEEAHVRFFRRSLGADRIARPAIDLMGSFTAAARAAGIIGSTDIFDPFADESSFLLAAFVFEDVGVTAFKGSARFLTNKDFLEATAGVLAVEAYHAGIIRTVLFARGLRTPAQQISDLRDGVDGATDIDQGIIGPDGLANLVPTDGDAIAFSRTPRQVLNIVFLQANAVSGGFFPQGVNGGLNGSTA